MPKDSPRRNATGPSDKYAPFAAMFRDGGVAVGISRLEDGCFIDANKAFLRLFRYTRREVIGRTALELGLWPYPEERAELLRRLRRGEAVTGFEARYRRKDGRLGELTIAARIIDLNGTPHMYGMLVDISEHKRLQAALRENEARLRMALSATHLPVFHQDAKLRYTWIANPSMGFQAEEVIGRTDLEILGRVGGAELTRIKRRVLREARGTRAEVWLQRQDRSACYDLNVEPEFDTRGRVVGLLCTALDITERKRAEEALRMQADILASLHEGVNMVDPGGVIRYTNAAFDRMFGYAPGELTGAHVSVLNAEEEDPQRVARAIMAALRQHGRWDGDLKNRRRDGSNFWTHTRIVASTHPKLGKVWVALRRDITELHRARTERDAAQGALERLTEHIQAEAETLRREIAREVHDEIGAALTGIGLRIEAKLLDPGMAERRDLNDLRALRAQVDLALARTRELCSRLRPPILDDLGLVETCRWYLRDWARQTGVKVRSRCTGPTPEPNDELRTDLFRIFQELLTNIARHAGARRVDFALSAGAKAIRLRLQDDGRGFDPSQAKGFGLIGIRERLRRHDGMMYIESTPQGTRTIIKIPLTPP